MNEKEKKNCSFQKVLQRSQHIKHIVSTIKQQWNISAQYDKKRNDLLNSNGLALLYKIIPLFSGGDR